MYRAVTFYFLQKNIDLEDPEQISNALDDVQIELGTGKESEKVWLNGRDISNEIRQMPVSNLVSTVSAIPAVRRKMVKLQQEMRSEERRVGKECVSTCRSRWAPGH